MIKFALSCVSVVDFSAVLTRFRDYAKQKREREREREREMEAREKERERLECDEQKDEGQKNINETNNKKIVPTTSNL